MNKKIRAAISLFVSMCCMLALVIVPISNAQPASAEETASEWITEVEVPTDYGYSFAIVGDTQIITKSHPDKLHYIYDHIVEKAQERKTAHVFGLGDITDGDTTAEWEVAKTEIAKLDGVVPYSLIRGNHDTIQNFNKYFGKGSPFANQYIDRFEEEGYTNTVYEIVTEQLDYLVVTLDFGPTDAALEWASNVIKAHPYHNVIISTHAYLNTDEALLGEQAGGYNSGQDIWDKFVSKHENIVMVLSGHVSRNDIQVRQSEGENGNVVTQFMINPQGMDVKDPTGMVAWFYFSEDGKTVDIQYYSTIKESYYNIKHTQLTLNTIARKPLELPEKIEDSTQEDNSNSSNDSQGSSSNGGGSGCASVIGGVSAGAIALVGAGAFIFLKKRKSE